MCACIRLWLSALRGCGKESTSVRVMSPGALGCVCSLVRVFQPEKKRQKGQKTQNVQNETSKTTTSATDPALAEATTHCVYTVFYFVYFCCSFFCVVDLCRPTHHHQSVVFCWDPRNPFWISVWHEIYRRLSFCECVAKSCSKNYTCIASVYTQQHHHHHQQ